MEILLISLEKFLEKICDCPFSTLEKKAPLLVHRKFSSTRATSARKIVAPASVSQNVA